MTVYANAGPQTVFLAGITPGTSGNSTVTVSASSSDNGSVITSPTIIYANPNNTGSLTFTPTGAAGTASVTVTVNNGGTIDNPTNQVFTVTVLPVPQTTPPTLNPLNNVVVYENAGVQTVNLTGISAGTSGNPTVNVYSVSSDNGSIISAPTVNYAS